MAGSTHLRLAVALLVAAAFLVPAPANAGAGTLQPGDDISLITNITFNGERISPLSGCTLSFAYDGVGAHAGKVFFSTAAHCVTGVGQVLSSEGFPNFGTVVFQGDPDSTIRDFALIEVAPAFHSAVTGEVRGHPGVPVGVATPADTAPGDLVRMSGWGLAFTQTEVTREQRVGYLLNHETDIIQFIGPVVQGDSGGPWFTDDGLALGIASKISFSIPPGVIGVENAMPYWTDFIRDEGPTIQNFLVDAAAHGFTIQLRTA